ncbi:uncharacterized protein SAPINGB_P002240 [Magnusiomyces paraingens]|uniref:Pentafunctional AROM polypeptide n=1 Tax=Magnusiomyces paraingens TaxID=2606893 RepID=A0A5E8BDJ0_9ASCO|nr:uncharacterized protein SAPINGB_P002240 [Saprochaete ingens]VVT49376.1 unnamed protein product [Saprochaete ingens]
MTSEITKISILGTESIHIGYHFSSHIVSTVLKELKSTTYVLISDDNIFKFGHVQRLEAEFAQAIKDSNSSSRLLKYIIPPGESSKNRTTKAEIEDFLLKERCTRDTVILAIGGGVIGDMIGYVAATFMRGVRFVQIPTTLLAMVDSSIGGKTAVDTPLGKNLIGAFWQPKFIFMDLTFLETLPEREFINGLAEVIKTAAMWDEEKFIELENNNEILLKYIKERKDGRVDLEPIIEIVRKIVYGSASIKAEVVTLDEREGGLRNLLNFGHTIGHAYEAILTPHILHGECVSIGMVLEAEVARFLGHLSDGAVARLSKCLAAYELPITPNDAIVRRRSRNISTPVDQLLDIMNVDKKNDGNVKKIVMLTRIGKTLEKQATKVSDDVIRTVLSESFLVGSFKNAPESVSVIPPGSKSISNRALVLASLGEGVCRISNLLHSDDTEHMLNAVQVLGGTKVNWENHGEILVVEGNGGKFKAPSSEIYLGNAGTASRFLTTVATLVQPSSEADHVVLTGNARMKQRPIGPLVDSLRENGSKVEFQESTGSLPLKIKAGLGFKGGLIELKATVSSQYVSSILMCAPYAENPVTLSLVGGKPISQLYIDMTIAMMETFGVKVTKGEGHVYHIPKATYKNPAEYVIESDASSATYPLAFAAISGTSVTVPNIGSSSLQGDARFAVDVLRPMGCEVIQTATSTTVTGPPVNTLKSIPMIDMEPMTDAFLTAAVLAAVAKDGENKTTRIYGIANQRVKECNRIDAMIHELAKFGVTTREHADGLEIDGVEIDKLTVPKGGVSTYDDHRVAMSFSLLASALPEPVLIKERRCVEKTWPGWWDILNRVFKVGLDAYEDTVAQAQEHRRTPNEDKTIVVVGMRGAGKTFMGQWVATSLGLKFVDLDQYLEAKLEKSIPEIIKESGWEGFRNEELTVLREFLEKHPRGWVAACGGGIVETPEARTILKEYMASGRIVLHVHRNIENIVSYLEVDKTRPAYTSDIFSVWKRREQWYFECSNYFYFASNFSNSSESASVHRSLDLFLKTITGTRGLPDVPKGRSAFVCLTFGDVRDFAGLKESLEGSSAVELRVDLLKNWSLEYVAEQVGFIRLNTDLPIIFTVRTKSQGGKFPDDGEEEAEKLIRLAYKLGVEYVDLELTWPVGFVDSLVKDKGYSKVIASHHDTAGKHGWTSALWEDYYQRALTVGDVIKFVGTAKNLQDNIALEQFRSVHTRKPFVAINMGEAGKLSRVLNEVLTPVTHESFPIAAAPGQLTVREINGALAAIGGLPAKEFFVCGGPAAQSRSPALHNALYKALNIPHQYSYLATESAEEVFAKIGELGDKFGGASVTIPLKLAVLPFLSELTPAAKAIGAVNTIIPLGNGKFKGDNTDWIGIVKSFEAIGLSGGKKSGDVAGVVIGAGGTSRAAIEALHAIGYGTIYLVNRTEASAREVAAAFPAEYGVKVVVSEEEYGGKRAEAVVSCVPASAPLDEKLARLVDGILSGGANSALGGSSSKYFLDVAYMPVVTPLAEKAKAQGYATIGGRDMLVYQGVAQFDEWTGQAGPVGAAMTAVYQE